MANELMNELKRRMDGALEALRREFGGPAHRARLGPSAGSVMVKAYGSDMPLNQVGTVSVPEPRMITVQVWDRSLVTAVEKAIREANLGLNPAIRRPAGAPAHSGAEPGAAPGADQDRP